MRFCSKIAAMFAALMFVSCVDDNGDGKKEVGRVKLADETIQGELKDDDGDGCADAAEYLLCEGSPSRQQASALGGQSIQGDGNQLFVRPVCQSVVDGSVLPAAPELCDGVDNDCDGLVDEDPASNVPASNFDGDSQADCKDDDDDNDGIPDALDCADNDAAVRPGATETCDGKDNDCNGVTDPENAVGCTNFYQDLDGDTFGNSTVKCLCAADTSNKLTATTNTDCKDDDAAINPKAAETCDGKDNDCNSQIDENAATDTDGDGAKDCFDEDDDGDGVPDTSDNCPNSFGQSNSQTDTDGDKLGDVCDPDDDQDGDLDGADNCPLAANADQLDTDLDGLGDACDLDVDADAVPNATDNCPLVKNNDQLDTDGDKKGNACDDDDDNDTVLDPADNCPLAANTNQLDSDGDKSGDACDLDDDNDGVADTSDNCPLVANTNQLDTDGDKKGDACEDDTDGDGDPDATDCNDTNPGIKHGAVEICDGVDNNCSGTTDEGFPNTDGDSQADCLDADTDNDGDPNATDCKPLDPKIHSNVAHDECDAVDNDCDGQTDESPSALTAITFYFDGDNDGFGLTGQTLKACASSIPFTAVKGGDCLDGNPAVYPGATDVPGNGIDEDCSGSDAVPGCTPSCVGKVCGSNGCGGSCGNCDSDEVCSVTGNACTPLFETGLCGNGVDDDKDGKIDCADNDCAGSSASCGCTAASQCDDGNVCTTDACPASGTCTHTATSGPCSDGKPCTTADACANGVCVGGVAPNCDDTNACTIDSCDAVTGCKHVQISSPACALPPACNGSGDCGVGEVCESGFCQPDLKGQTPAGSSGANAGPLPDGSSDKRDNDGDGYCEVAPCTGGSADPSRSIDSLKGGDCDDGVGSTGTFAVGCSGDNDNNPSTSCQFTTDGSWGNNPGVTDFPGDIFDNNCDGNVQ